MIESLEITRFKSIRDQVLDLGRVNLFIGGNGTGKSNILEAVGLVSACLGRGLGDSDLSNTGVRVTPPELMKSSFKNEDLPRTLELHAHLQGKVDYKVVLTSRENDPLLRFVSESSTASGKKIFGRSHRGAKATGVTHADRLDRTRGIWDQIKATYDIPAGVDKIYEEISRYKIYMPQTDILRGRRKGYLNSSPVGNHGEALPEAVDTLLDYWRDLKALGRKGKDDQHKILFNLIDQSLDLVWLPGWASQVGVEPSTRLMTSRDQEDRAGNKVYFRDRFMHGMRNKLSVYDSSEGTLFLLFAAIVLSHPEAPRVFALDNVDNGLNPRLTKLLVKQFIKVTNLVAEHNLPFGAKQVFLTSHNPTSLDAFDLFDDNHRVFVVKRNEKGHTEVDRLEPPKGMAKEDWEIALGGRNLSQLWLDKAIPHAMGEL